MILDLPVRPGLRILVTSRPVDFRRGMDSLSTLVKETLAADPFAGDVFVFRSKRAQLVS
jgi:transposase